MTHSPSGAVWPVLSLFLVARAATRSEPYFMYFWADDTPERVAAGLIGGLDAVNQKCSGMRQ